MGQARLAVGAPAVYTAVVAAEAEGVLAGHHHDLHLQGETDGAHGVLELHLVTRRGAK